MGQYLPGFPNWHDDPLSGEELERVDGLARRTQKVLVEGSEADLSGGGLAFLAPQAEEFWVRIDGIYTSMLPEYLFTEMFFDEAANAWAEVDGGMASGAGGPFFAEELNGNVNVPAGVRVKARWLSPLRLGFTWQGLTVQEADGSPSVAPATVLQFDQSTGLVVTDSGGGVALVSLTGGADVAADQGRSTTIEIRRPFGAATATTTGVACTIFEDLAGGRAGSGSTNQLNWTHYLELASTVDIRDACSRTAGLTYEGFADGDEVREPNASGTHYVVVWVTKRVVAGTTVKRVYISRDTPAWPGP